MNHSVRFSIKLSMNIKRNLPTTSPAIKGVFDDDSDEEEKPKQTIAATTEEISADQVQDQLESINMMAEYVSRNGAAFEESK